MASTRPEPTTSELINVTESQLMLIVKDYFSCFDSFSDVQKHVLRFRSCSYMLLAGVCGQLA